VAKTPTAPAIKSPRRGAARSAKVTAKKATSTVGASEHADQALTPVAGDLLEFLPQRPSAMARVGERHAVFIDVENTSSEADLGRVLDDLQIDRKITDITAVGNWRVVGQHLGRMLAQRGAHLVHSAPAPRVPDWSDLWIAVTAGMWLGRAAPGDSLCILSDDRAFDAVGDAAARLGVRFRRITYRSSASAASERAAADRATPADGHAGGRRRRRRRRGDSASAGSARTSSASAGRAHQAHVAAHAAVSSAAASASAEEERHAASLDQIRAVIARLTAPDPVRGVNLDTLTLSLKAEGFQRPPGSPRLVTRLRRIKDVELLPNGRVRLADAIAGLTSAAVEESDDVPATVASEEGSAAVNGADHAAEPDGSKTGAKRRPRRRGGRRRGGRRRSGAAAGPEAGV
jgi:hypothetical protein